MCRFCCVIRFSSYSLFDGSSIFRIGRGSKLYEKVDFILLVSVFFVCAFMVIWGVVRIGW